MSSLNSRDSIFRHILSNDNQTDENGLNEFRRLGEKDLKQRDFPLADDEICLNREERRFLKRHPWGDL